MQAVARGTGLALGLLGVLFLNPLTTAQDKENPILTSVKSGLKNPEKPFTLVIRVTVKEGAGERLEAAFAKSRRETRKEKGNIAYDLSRDTREPTHYLVYERWKDLAALEAHLNAEHTKKLLGELPDILAGQPESQVLLPAGE
jgi:quinol monooxygenase YgiN